MGVINLSSRDYRRISEIAKLTHDVRVLKRAQALLWLSDGDNAYEVADCLLAAPRTIYRWVERFEVRGDLPLVESDSPMHRVADGRIRWCSGLIRCLSSSWTRVLKTMAMPRRSGQRRYCAST